MTLDVIAVGAANADILVKVRRVPRRDEELNAESMTIMGGGSAANVAVGCVRLGLKAGLIGYVGRDLFGRMVVDELRGEGVDLSNLKVVEAMTGTAICIVDGDGERRIIVYGEAGSQLSIRDLDEEYLGKARIVYVSSIKGGCGLDVASTIFECSNKSGVEVFFDPGSLYAIQGLSSLKDAIAMASMVKLNWVEAKMLTGRDNLNEAVRVLKEAGVKSLIITLGVDGCYIASEDLEKKIPTYTEFQPIDKTGAGDAFNVGFLFGYLRGWNLEKCGRFGNLIASISVTRMGARSTPRLNELTGYREFDEFKEEFY